MFNTLLPLKEQISFILNHCIYKEFFDAVNYFYEKNFEPIVYITNFKSLLDIQNFINLHYSIVGLRPIPLEMIPSLDQFYICYYSFFLNILSKLENDKEIKHHAYIINFVLHYVKLFFDDSQLQTFLIRKDENFYIDTEQISDEEDCVWDICPEYGEAQSEEDLNYIKPKFDFKRTEFLNNYRKQENLRKTGGDIDLNIGKLRTIRQKKAEASKQEGGFIGELQTTTATSNLQVRAKKEHNREGYELRAGKQHVSTPYHLTLRFKTTLDVYRLKKYNESHFCTKQIKIFRTDCVHLKRKCNLCDDETLCQHKYKQCNLCFNIKWIKTCGDRRPNKIRFDPETKLYVPYCDHNDLNENQEPREIITNKFVNSPCFHCHQFKLVKLSRRACSCDANYCTNCFFSDYRNDGFLTQCSCPDQLEVKKKNVTPRTLGFFNSYADAAKRDDLDIFFDKKLLKFKKFNQFNNSLEEIGEAQAFEQTKAKIIQSFLAIKDMILSGIASVVEQITDRIILKKITPIIAFLKTLTSKIIEESLDILTFVNLILALVNAKSIFYILSLITNIILLFDRLMRNFSMKDTIQATFTEQFKKLGKIITPTIQVVPQLPTQYHADADNIMRDYRIVDYLIDIERTDSAKMSVFLFGDEVYVPGLVKVLDPDVIQFLNLCPEYGITHYLDLLPQRFKPKYEIAKNKFITRDKMINDEILDVHLQWMATGLEFVEGHFLIDHLSELLDPQESLVEEIGEEQGDNILSRLIDFFSNIFKLPLDRCTKFFMMANLRNFNTVISAGMNFKKIALALLNFCPAFMQEYFNPDLKKNWLKKELQKSNSKCALLTKAAIQVSVDVESNESKEVIAESRAYARTLMNELQRELIVMGIGMDVDILRWLKILKDIIGTAGTTKQRDKEPFCVRFTGNPGCGKSTYWPVFVSPLFSDHSVTEISRDLTYTRNPGMPFWDGYMPDNHKIILYDDFGQDAKEEDYLELITVVSKCNFIPNFASVDPTNTMTGCKGQVADPKLVVLLTNQNRVNNSVAVKSAQAVERRPHITVEIGDAMHGIPMPPDEVKATIYARSDPKSSLYQVKPIAIVTGFVEVQKAILRAYREFCNVNRKINLEQDIYKYVGKDGLNIIGNSQSLEETFIDIIYNAWYMGAVLSGVGHGLGIAAGFATYGFLQFSLQALTEFFKPAKPLMDKQTTIFLAACGGALVSVLWFSGLLKKMSSGWGKKMFNLFMADWDGEDQSSTTNTKAAPAGKLVSGRAQSSSEVENIEKHIANNMATLKVGPKSLQCLFIKGRYFITVRHVFIDSDLTTDRERKLIDDTFDYFEDDTPMYLTFANGNVIEQKFKKNRMKEMFNDGDPLADVMMYECDTLVPMKKDIVNYFVSNDKLFKNSHIGFTTLNNSGQNIIKRYSLILDDMIDFKYFMGREKWMVAKCFSYDVPTKKGDCGSIVYTDQEQPKIIGIHVAGILRGGVATGVGIRVTKQSLEQMFKKLDNFSIDLDVSCGIAQNLTIVPLEGKDERLAEGISRIGILEGVKSYPIGKTDIRPSPLHGKIVTPTTAPSIINIYDKRLNGTDLMLKGINKYGSVPPQMDKNMYNELLESFDDDYNLDSGITGRVITLDEAINGSDIINKIDMTTSPAFPFSLLGKGGEKKKLFDLIDDNYKMLPELEADYNFLLKNFKKGIVPFYPWVDCLKDERRTLDKIKDLKTRLFSAAPLSFVLIQKQYYGLFLQHMNAIRIKIYNRVGMNKDSVEWDDHIRKLNEVSDVASDVDYSSKDGNNRICNVEHFFDCMDRWYSRFYDMNEEEKIVRRCIKEMETHSYHVYFDKDFKKWLVYQLTGKTNSGTLITIAVNSHSDELDMRLAWLKLAPKELKDIYFYKRFVRTAVVGDDLVIAVNEFVREWFNMEEIAKTLLEEGSILTGGDHGSKIEFKPLMECVFLKNKTGKMYGRYVPLMNEEAMLDPINWMRVSDFMISADQACEDNCNSVLRNVFWYGEKSFTNVRRAILKEKPFYNLVNFRALSENFFEDGIIYDPLSLNGRRTKNL